MKMEFYMNWLIAVVLLFFVMISGCANRNSERNRIENSLLQANRRLEEALVVTHNQLVDLKRENETLKVNTANNDNSDSTPLPIISYPNININNNKQDQNNIPVSPPPVIIPNSIESTKVPDSLKGTKNETLPVWKPHR
ncbi:MAG: hypothetical protein LBC74_14740 [Planctomycetaceae bacterium]|jgi:hypothetical protein|nr:hypothetical protein [Planctomycetaceae bacterium]